MSNRLASETSLYLRQHANNPVDWYPWGDEALAWAKAQDKAIFLSIGYSACHWCHVMEHESFEDDATAAVMNEHFVCIKVDREERPDLDSIYMTSLQLLTREGGGWPLSVFLTPSLTPFYAGTYFPAADKYGRPSFRRVLLAVAESWKTKREQLENVGNQVADALQESMALSSQNGELSEATLLASLEALKRNYDPEYGGFGRAPKFPHAVDLRLLLRLGHRFKDQTAIDMVTHTLTMMARGGIYDQIGGGFARYSVDEKWLVPHFEKMLYDNALLVSVYLETAQVSGDEYFAEIAEEILMFVQVDLYSLKTGALYSTLDADSEGDEGKYYVWDTEEIEAVLGDNADFARRVWGVTASGNFEHRCILFRSRSDQDDAASMGMTLEDFREKLDAIKQTLGAERDKRIRPGRDEKILTAWNALMISAMAEAGRILSSSEPLGYAYIAMEHLIKSLRGPDGRLLRTCGDNHPAKLDAYLEDYAYLVAALLCLYEADFNADWLTSACELADIMLADFHDPAGGFFYTREGQSDLIARTKDWHDGSTPSGNAVAATVLLKLAILCDRPDYRRAAEQTLEAFRGLITDNPAAAAQMLIALDWHLGPVREVTVIGDAPDLLHKLQSEFHPRQLLAFHNPASGEPPAINALLRGKTMIDGQVTTYICRNYQCDAPIVGEEAAMLQFETRP